MISKINISYRFTIRIKLPSLVAFTPITIFLA